MSMHSKNPSHPLFEVKPPASTKPGQSPQRLGNIISAGNEGNSMAIFGNVLEHPESMILVGSILHDGLTIAPYSNQPLSNSGLTPEKTKILQSRFMVAPGTIRNDFGTSFAAPRISGALSKLLDYNPKLSVQQGQNILLESADPILIDRFGKPYDLTDVPSGQVEKYLKQKGIPLDDLLRGREVYGMGRLNVKRALEVAYKLKGSFWKNSQ